MPCLRSVLLAFVPALLITSAFSQTALNVPAPPADPLELAMVAKEVPNTPQARSAILELIERAKQNGGLHTAGGPPFSMRVSFSASGEVLYTGTGEMEETWLSQRSSRWSARLADFSMTRIFADGSAFDDRPISMIPLRVQMLRDAIFWPIWLQDQAKLRTATANWKGKEVTCVLTSGEGVQAVEIVGRRWVEREYCIEPKSGLLQILSDAPGIYVVYDYTGALEFHGRTLPRQISIMEGGKNVLEARLETISDAGSMAADLLRPSQQMVTQGPILSNVMRFPQVIKVAPGSAILQPVIVHVVLGEDGKVLDAELVENTGAELSKSALALVKRSTYRPVRERTQLQREAFINVKFISE